MPILVNEGVVLQLHVVVSADAPIYCSAKENEHAASQTARFVPDGHNRRSESIMPLFEINQEHDKPE